MRIDGVERFYDRAVLGVGLGVVALFSLLGLWWANNLRGLLLGIGVLVPFLASTLAYPPARRAGVVASLERSAAFCGVWLAASGAFLAVAFSATGNLRGDTVGSLVRMVAWEFIPCVVYLAVLYFAERSFHRFGERRR